MTLTNIERDDIYAELESDHRRGLAFQHANTYLFGFSVPMEYRRQDISVSYTKLSSSEPRKVRERGNDLAHRPVDRYYYAPIRTSGTRFDEVLSDLITESRLSVRSSRGVRLLLTGRAGSGKTTTCQWLSTLTADAPLGSLRSVNIIPFFVALRRVMKNRPSGTAATPRGRELVSSLLASNYDSHVDAWVESVLDSGRAFVLLDGLDELTELELLQTRTWLASLMDKYPRSHFMVTSRPEGLDDGFFMIEGFVHSSLMPLSEDDVRECVGAWFHAMEKSRPYADPAEWGQIKAKLLNAIEHRASIRTLASTPLLVAMLCSFYASDPDQEPRDQTELYEKVTDALIDKRERDREAVDLDFVNFRVDAKRHILGRVAWAMTENQETTIFRNEAYRRVSRNQLVATGDTFDGVVRACLANMPNVTQPVSDVSSYLVRRSTVLEEVVEGEISFVHRSFQEYFAALGLPEGSREKLGALAKTVNWSRVTSFAASRLDPRSSAALLTDLLSTARVFPDRRRHMILLAAECMNRMVELEPAVADSVRAAVWSIWPPEAPDEAQDFAAIGDPMLAWFDTIVERSEKDFSACILVAGLIGSRASLQFLSFLADKGGSPRNADDFLTHWDRYDYEQFATKVVRPLAQRGAAIRVDTCTKLAALKVVTNTRNLILDIKRPDGDLDVLKDFAHISEIDIRFGDLESLSAIRGLASLRSVTLRNAQVVDLDGIPDNVAFLHIQDCGRLESIAGLKRPGSLRVLTISGSPRFDADHLAALTRLQTLRIRNCGSIDFSSLASVQSLRVLDVDIYGSGVLDLSDRPSLRRAALRAMRGRVPRLNLPDALVELHIHGSTGVKELGDVPRALRILSITGDYEGVDFEKLRHLDHLEELEIESLSLQNLDALGELLSLQSLTLSAPGIGTLDALGNHPSLSRITLSRCNSLESISALLSIANLSEVVIVGGAERLSAEDVNSLGSIVTEFQPFDETVGHGGS